MTGPLAPDRRAPSPADGRRARGERSRQATLTEAVQLASRIGLEGLSIGGLADRLGTAKSSVHASFGSKERLQLATLARTREILVDVVVAPALEADAGADRLGALGETWFAYLADDVFEGGCVLCAASAEVDGRPGPVRDAVAAVMAEWLDLLADNVRAGQGAGELDPSADPDQVAFELHALGMAANWKRQLFEDPTAVPAAHRAWTAALDRLRTPPADHPDHPDEGARP